MPDSSVSRTLVIKLSDNLMQESTEALNEAGESFSARLRLLLRDLRIEPVFPEARATETFRAARDRQTHRDSNDEWTAPGAPLDPRKFLRVFAPDLDAAQAIAEQLNASSDIEHAYVEGSVTLGILPEFMGAQLQPQMRLALDGAVPASIGDFSGEQPQFRNAPSGMGITSALAQLGGLQSMLDVRGADIEFAWIADHTEFNTPILVTRVSGGCTATDKQRHHGTAAIGVAIASADNIGINGIASGVKEVRCYSICGGGTNTARAIKRAALEMCPGDVLMLELQVSRDATPSPPLPLEWECTVYEAVRQATDDGIIVVAAAGNGLQSLDDPSLNRRFDRTFRDSGAIIVGAGAPPDFAQLPDRARLSISNFGSRVDVQAYGEHVVSCGGGDRFGQMETNNPTRWYTKSFNGTSSATALIWALCLLIQGLAKKPQILGRAISPKEMRDLVSTYVSPQMSRVAGATIDDPIGGRPDLVRILAALRNLPVAIPSWGKSCP